MAKKYDKYTRSNDVEISSITITSDAGGAQSIKEIVKGFSIYEHIDGQYMIATIDFVDNAAFVTKFPIIGQETIVIKYRTPGFGYRWSKVKFDVMKIGKRTKSMRGSSEYYQLTCVSSDKLTLSTNRIGYSMQGTTSKNIRKILRTSGYRKGKYRVDTSKYYGNWVIPSLTIHETLRFLTKRSRTKTTALSDFILFETSSGWNCRSLSNLFKKPTTIEYRKTEPDSPRTPMRDYTLIQDMQVLSYYNRHKELNNAQHSGKMITFDWTKKTTNVSFGNSELVFRERSRTNSTLEKNRNLQKKNRYDTQFDTRVYFRHQSSGLHGVDEKSLDRRIEKNESENISSHDSVYTTPSILTNFHSHPNDYQSHLLSRRMSTIGFDSMRVLIKVSGNSSLNVGDVVSLMIPSSNIPGRKNHDIVDKSVSGRYIITNIKQHVTLLAEQQFISYIELARDTSPLTMPDNNKFLGTDKQTAKEISDEKQTLSNEILSLTRKI